MQSGHRATQRVFTGRHLSRGAGADDWPTSLPTDSGYATPAGWKDHWDAELDDSELLYLLEDARALSLKVDEAILVLQAHRLTKTVLNKK